MYNKFLSISKFIVNLKITFVFLIMLFLNLNFSSIAFSQVEQTINGQLFEKGTKKQLSNVNIYLLPSKLKTSTDSSGNFNFVFKLDDSIQNQELEVVINSIGYKKLTYKLEAPLKNIQQPLILFLEKEVSQYLETVVTGLREKKDSQQSLKAEEFLTLPGSGGDPVKAVQNLPGVNRTIGGDARVVIQGSEPENTKYNILGHEVPLVFHFGGLSSIITPEAISSVDYYSAGYSADLGRALGGHVGLNVKSPETTITRGFAFLDIYNTGGLIEGPIDEKSSYLISGRYSYLGAVLKSVAKKNKDFNLIVAPSYYDFSFLYQRKFENSDYDNIKIFTITSQDRLEFVLNKPIGNDPKTRGSFYQRTEFSRIIPEWNHQIDETSTLQLSTAYGNNDIIADVGSNYFHLKNKSLTTKAHYEKSVSSINKATIGFQTFDDWFNVGLKFPVPYSEGGVTNPIATGDLKESKIKGHDNYLGIYFINKLQTDESSPLIYVPQLRYDYFSPTKENHFQPRFTLKYKVSENLLLRASTGIYYQAPAPQEYDSTWGNPNIKSTKAVHYVMGFENDFREGQLTGLTASANIFYKNLEQDIISSQATVQRNGISTFEKYNNKGTGFIKGFETQFKYKDSNNIQWILSYANLQSRRKKPNEPELPSQYDQTHSFNLLTSIPKENWLIGARVRYVTGNPYTPIVGSTFDADNDVYIPERGQIFSSRYSNFFQVDFRIDRKWIYDTWIFSAYLDVQNATNHSNQESITYSYDYTQKSEITSLPMIPTLGVKGEF